MRVALGGTAVLPCKLIDTAEPLQQISWQRKTREKVQTDNFYTIQRSGPVFVNGNDRRFQFIGSFKDNNGTLQLTNVLLKDEGVYTCIFTVFPSGNHKTEIPLTIFGITTLLYSPYPECCVCTWKRQIFLLAVFCVFSPSASIRECEG